MQAISFLRDFCYTTRVVTTLPGVLRNYPAYEITPVYLNENSDSDSFHGAHQAFNNNAIKFNTNFWYQMLS